MAGGHTSEEVFDRGAVKEIGGLLSQADNLFQTAEEEHFDANSWSGGFHN